MNTNNSKYKLLILTTLLCYGNLSNGAPRRSSQTTFDQKQTGEYNIQLHLKDFQIIAVVGDDSFSNFGDYDYSYDYSDFTVKPPSTTTKKPDSSTTTETSESESLSSTRTTTKKPQFTDPYPIISPSTTTTTRKPSDATTTKLPSPIEQSSVSIIPTSTHSTNNAETQIKKNETTIIKHETSSPLSTLSVTTSVPFVSTTARTTTLSPSSSRPSSSSASPTIVSSSSPSPTTVTSQTNRIVPGQIPVIVQDFNTLRDDKPIIKDTKPHEKKGEVVTSVTIVPLDDTNASSPGAELGEQPALGEILHYRRCAQGYQRDKRGRCRKVRRPQIPSGITRFASNLATRFRQAGHINAENMDAKDLV